MTRCPTSDLPVEMCACCVTSSGPAVTVLDPAGPPRRRNRARPPREPVRYRLPDGVHAAGPRRSLSPGVCIRCKQPYSAGALIRDDPDTGLRVAECCFTALPIPSGPQEAS